MFLVLVPAFAVEEGTIDFLIAREDLPESFVYSQVKRSSFDSTHYRYENYYWRTNLGDSVWLKLQYEGEMINAFEGDPSWLGLDDATIIAKFSSFMTGVRKDVSLTQLKSAKEIVESITQNAKYSESYVFGPFGIEWTLNANEKNAKFSVDYFVELRNTVNQLLLNVKLRDAVHAFIEKRTDEGARAAELSKRVDDLFFSSRRAPTRAMDPSFVKIILIPCALLAGVSFVTLAFLWIRRRFF
jgi:hypothetical protein